MTWGLFGRVLPFYLAAEWVARRRRAKQPGTVVPIRPDVQVRKAPSGNPLRRAVRWTWLGVRLGVELMGWLAILVGILAWLAPTP